MKEPSKTEMLRAIRELLNIKHKMKKHHISYLCKAKFGKPLAKMEKYQIRELYDFFELGEQKEKEYKNELIKNYEENKERGVLPRAIIKARDNDRCFMCNDSIGIEIEINDTIKKVNDIVENGEATCIWCESFESWCECESFAARSFRPLPLWE